MADNVSDDELKLNRRLFLQYAAAASATSAVVYGIALKTDALAQEVNATESGRHDTTGPYPYHNG